MNETRKIEALFEVGRIIVALAIAYILTLFAIMLISDSPFEAVYMFSIGPFTSARRFGQLIAKFIPYLFVGTGMCFIYASNRFNLIGEGAYLLAGCIVALVATTTNIAEGPHFLVITLLLTIAAIIGVILGLIPAAMRELLGVNEVVVSIMMNYGVLYLVLYILKIFMKDRTITYLGSTLFDENIKLLTLIPGTTIHSGIFLGLIIVIVSALVFYKTPLGYAIRIAGSNPDFAKAAGINISVSLIVAQLIGAGLAGIGGAVDLLGIYDRFTWTMLTQMGFDGLLVAVLARKNPTFVPIGAFLLAYLRTGASILNYTTEIPIEFVMIMQAIIILLIAAKQFMGGWKQQVIFNAAKRKANEELVD